MITKNELKYYSSLLQKKNRVSEKKFIAEGKKILHEALESNYKADIVFCTNEFKENNNEYFENELFANIKVEIIHNRDFEKLADTINPQGICGIFNIKTLKIEREVKSSLAAALENINDPGNLGTIIRNCDWFGVKDIFVGNGCAEIFSPKVIRASMGSVFHLNFFEEADIVDALISMQKKKYEVVTAHLKGNNIYNFIKGKKTIIAFCNEANGPSQELLEISDRLITIPQKGKAESLNVASASAVILSELTK